MKKIVPFLLAILIVYIVAVNVYDKIEYSKMSFEEKILAIMNTNEFSSDAGSADKIAYLEEVDGGYFCVAISTEWEELSFGYIREKNGELEYAGETFGKIDSYIYNDDPTLTYKTSILNFSEINWYYGFYQHKDDIHVMINEEEVPIQNFSIDYKGEIFNMDFWLIRCEDAPKVIIT